jgi:hypothetical protein
MISHHLWGDLFIWPIKIMLGKRAKEEVLLEKSHLKEPAEPIMLASQNEHSRSKSPPKAPNHP